MENRYIAICGLDCKSCEARLATVNNDDKLREKVAALWSDLNQVEITPEMINCMGCRLDGVKTIFCDRLCPIRQCALKKGHETCAACPDMPECETLRMVTDKNEEAAKRLRIEKEKGN